MPEWQTYSLADFLMFAPRTYWQLVELYNAGVWPAQAAVVAVGCAALLLAARGGNTSVRIVHALLAAAWAWVAWGWLHLRFAAINWPPDYAAAVFAVEAALLAAFALRRDGLQAAARSDAPRAGLVIAAFAVAAYPFTFNLWCYIDSRDVATACRLAMERKTTGFEAVYIVARNTLMREPTLELVNHFFPGVKNIKSGFGENQSPLDGKRAREVLDFEPKYTWEMVINPEQV